MALKGVVGGPTSKLLATSQNAFRVSVCRSWCQNHDQPYEISSQEEWDEAVEAGNITPEHWGIRLQNVFAYLMDLESGAEYDEDGFRIGLTAGAVHAVDGVKLRVFPLDHEPPHVHIEIRGRPQDELRIRIDNAEPMDDLPRGLTTKKFKILQQYVDAARPELETMWTGFHSG